jgi:hypothetical protein
MAKIHTHYDNLKVARKAPQEVIRAAYKALSQKYHPDKNPGDEKAARIMAVVNSAYDTLSDPVRRKEHDDWIASEEWEVEWLESDRHDERDGRHEVVQQWSEDEVEKSRSRYRAARDPKWWGAMLVFTALGCVLGVLVSTQPQILPDVLASAQAPVASANAASVPRPEPAPGPVAEEDDPWATNDARRYELPHASPVRALAVTQLVIPPQEQDCEMDLHSLQAPNGAPWPQETGYLAGYPLANEGIDMQLVIDNSGNVAPVFVKVYDIDRRSNVRHLYVRARETMTVDKLLAGKYEVRYQNVEIGGTEAECAGRQRQLQQADAGDALLPNALPPN